MNDAKEVVDAEIGNVTLGTGVFEIASVEEFEGISKFSGLLTINESTTEYPWKLNVTGTATLVDHKWSLEFEAKGISDENNQKSQNYWHYEYEATSFKSAMKFTEASGAIGRVPVLAGRVSRVSKHPTGGAALKLRDGSATLKDLDPDQDFYPGGFTGTFQMIKQK